MKFMSTYAIRPGCYDEAITRFLAGGAVPPAGATLLGRWHKTDGSGGFSLYESDDPKAMCETAAVWADVLELHSNVVVEDDDAGAIQARLRGE